MTTLIPPKPRYKVELVEKDDEHFYSVDWGAGNAVYPGVTGYLNIIGGEKTRALMGWSKKEALASVERALLDQLNGKAKSRITLSSNWIKDVLARASKRPKSILDEAGDLGTQAHAFFDLIINRKELPPISEPLRLPILAFQEWYEKTGITVVMGDTKVASRIYGFGGGLDALGWKEGEYGILDWKTSNGIWKEYAAQVAAYSQALAETYGITAKWAKIVRFSKKPPVQFETKSVKNMTASFQAFLEAKTLTELMSLDHYE